METGTTFEQGRDIWHARSDLNGCTLRVTAPAVLRGENSLSIGCQTFGLTELLRDGKGEVGVIDAQNLTTPVTFQGVVQDGEFHVSDRRILSLADVGTHMLKAEVIETTPVGDHIMARTGVFGCQTDGHRHLFLASVRQSGDDTMVVARITSLDRGHGSVGSAHAFADFPECRPVVGATNSVLFGSNTNRNRERRVRVAPGQFPDIPRVP
jgi:hypothetical protein